jgi:lysophospholipase L1-like esterase
MGDSIAVGVGELEPGTPRAGFAAHVAHALDASMYVNVAANGARAAHVAREQLPNALMARPDVVLISVGGNDVLRGDFDPRQVRDDLASTLIRLQRPGRRIIVDWRSVSPIDSAGGS